jgi:hypothetical protein
VILRRTRMQRIIQSRFRNATRRNGVITAGQGRRWPSVGENI